MPAAISITSEDEKGLKSVTHFYVPTSFTAAQLIEAAGALANLVDDIIGGRIVAVGLCYLVALPGGLKATALANSDVEEGARFSWVTSANNLASNRLATFLEAKLSAGTKQVNLADVAVDAFVDAVLTGITVTGGTVTFTDYRDEDLVSVGVAREQFKKDRG